MAHNLNFRHGRASMMYVGSKPWHSFGTKVDHVATSAEAIEAAQLGYTVRAIPQFYRNDEGHQYPADMQATVRTDTWEQLGTVSGRYSILQNQKAFDLIDGLAGEQAAMYHTAGALGKGERVWLLVKLPDSVHVNGTTDTVDKFLLLTNSHDGKSSLRVFFTPIRVVCQNTLSAALGRGTKQGISIRHMGDMTDKLKEARRILGLANSWYQEQSVIWDHLSRFKLTQDALKAFTEQVIPMSEDGETSTRAENARRDIRQRFRYGIGQNNTDWAIINESLWSAVNAVAEHTDYAMGTRGETDRERISNRTESILWGTGADMKQRALDVAMEMAGPLPAMSA